MRMYSIKRYNDYRVKIKTTFKEIVTGIKRECYCF
jgi:hypothetical protein